MAASRGDAVDVPPAPSLLIVDDSPILLGRLVSLAREHIPGHRIHTATSATAAIALFGAISPALVVLDMSLPGLSGLAVLQHIRRRSSETQVVVFTNSGCLEMEIGCRLLGANHFLDKSKDITPLVELLRSFGRPEASAVYVT